MRVGLAGSVESNDIMITVSESDSLIIEIDSIVDAFFHDQIEKVIKDTLNELNISNVKVVCVDKGALDYTIKARLVTALMRMGVYHA